MPLSLSSTFLLFPITFTAFLLAGHLQPSFSQDFTTFPNCTIPFSCGSFQNITYPFTGGDRPSQCGPPEFRLTCRNNYPELTTNSYTYRVLHVNQTQQTLILSRLDLWNNTCPTRFFNYTLNSTIFTYGAENQDLSLIYGCNSTALPFRPYNLFACNVTGVNFTDAYYVSGALPRDPGLGLVRCYVTLTVPIINSAANGISNNLTSLGEALTEGFNVNYIDPYSRHCLDCIRSGWQCGYDTNASRPICICGDRLCIPAGERSNRQEVALKLAIGLSASGFTIIMIILMTIFYYRRKRFMVEKQGQMYDKTIEAFLKNHGSLAPKRFAYTDIKKMTNSFADKLGEGGYGSVFKGKLLNGHLVAVKLLNDTNSDGGDFVNEVASISRTSHVNIVTLLGFCLEQNKRALVYEFMPNKSLDKFIRKNGSSSLDWETLFQIAVGTARGLEYLHRGCNTRIVHFDIKPENILLDEDFCPKISDFGMAKLCQRKKSILSMMDARGTPGYIAPEVFSRIFGEVSHKSDVYSYGMMIINMLQIEENTEVQLGSNSTSQMYFPDFIYKHLELGVGLRGLREVIDENGEETLRKMVLVGLWCIQTNPLDRPSMGKVVEMLEGSIELIQVPPKPVLFSPEIANQDTCSELSSSCEIQLT